MIKVLNDGYVRLVDSMGDDLTIVNAARASFAKESTEMTDSDERLLKFIIRNKHDSCLRHCVVSFEVRAPLEVARQWYKHAVASTHLDDQLGWNEQSQRYVTQEHKFYVPEWFLGTPANKKQGAGDVVPEYVNDKFVSALMAHQTDSLNMYHAAMEAGIAAEQARLFLPAYGLYVNWRWTASLNAIIHFLSLRLDGHAQYEIRQYAAAVDEAMSSLYPLTMSIVRSARKA